MTRRTSVMVATLVLVGCTSRTGESEAALSPSATPFASVVSAGSQPHDVAPAADGGVWYSGQGNGTLGWLDPESGEVREIALGPGSAPHGVIIVPDNAAWLTDGGLNAIVR